MTAPINRSDGGDSSNGIGVCVKDKGKTTSFLQFANTDIRRSKLEITPFWGGERVRPKIQLHHGQMSNGPPRPWPQDHHSVTNRTRPSCGRRVVRTLT